MMSMRNDGVVLKREKLPNHVAIIMDGNGRWAKSKNRPRVFGHRQGMETVRTVVRAADGLGIKVLSLYAFSEENWGRPEREVSFIMRLLDTYLLRERDELNEQNIQLRVIGNTDRLPGRTRKLVEESVRMMSDNTGMVMNVALSYGGRAEIVEACQAIARRVAAGELAPDDINRESIEENLSTAALPDPDLLIRTSGEQRISNFMLWQMAYTEFYFTDVHWPAFTSEDFSAALAVYGERKRRFGLVPEAKSKTLWLTRAKDSSEPSETIC